MRSERELLLDILEAIERRNTQLKVKPPLKRMNGWEHLIRLSVSYPLAALAAAGGRTRAGLSCVEGDQRMSKRTNGWERLIRLSVSYPLAALVAAGGSATDSPRRVSSNTSKAQG